MPCAGSCSRSERHVRLRGRGGFRLARGGGREHAALALAATVAPTSLAAALAATVASTFTSTVAPTSLAATVAPTATLHQLHVRDDQLPLWVLQ